MEEKSDAFFPPIKSCVQSLQHIVPLGLCPSVTSYFSVPLVFFQPIMRKLYQPRQVSVSLLHKTKKKNRSYQKESIICPMVNEQTVQDLLSLLPLCHRCVVKNISQKMRRISFKTWHVLNGISSSFQAGLEMVSFCLVVLIGLKSTHCCYPSELPGEIFLELRLLFVREHNSQVW